MKIPYNTSPLDQREKMLLIGIVFYYNNSIVIKYWNLNWNRMFSCQLLLSTVAPQYHFLLLKNLFNEIMNTASPSHHISSYFFNWLFFIQFTIPTSSIIFPNSFVINNLKNIIGGNANIIIKQYIYSRNIKEWAHVVLFFPHLFVCNDKDNQTYNIFISL